MPHSPPRKNRSIERINSRIGLMPFTSVKKIAKQYRVLPDQLTVLRKPSNSLRLREEKIREYLADPKKHHLLFHPSVWSLWRIMEYAPSFSVREIREKIASELDHFRSTGQHPRLNREDPNLMAIRSNIRRLNLRTLDDVQQIQRRINEKKSRLDNRLSDEIRRKLVDAARSFFWNQKMYLNFTSKKIRYVLLHSSPDIQDEVKMRLLERINHESKKVPLDPALPESKLVKEWLDYNQGRITSYVIDALRQVGPKTRTGKRRSVAGRNLSFEEERSEGKEENPRPGIFPQDEKITFHTKLTPIQKEVFDLLTEGKRGIEIAYLRRVGQSRISQIIKAIRKKMNPPK